jgi:hypothetical protein
VLICSSLLLQPDSSLPLPRTWQEVGRGTGKEPGCQGTFPRPSLCILFYPALPRFPLQVPVLIRYICQSFSGPLFSSTKKTVPSYPAPNPLPGAWHLLRPRKHKRTLIMPFRLGWHMVLWSESTLARESRCSVNLALHPPSLSPFFTRSHDVAQAILELTILLPQPPECWDYRHASLHSAFHSISFCWWWFGLIF